jgi:hypothetical protein
MKSKKSLFFATLAFTGMFLLFGCTKTIRESTPKAIQTISSNDMKHLILAFKQRMNSNLKETDSVRVDSLVFYLTALTNYTYGDASSKGNYTSIDSAYISFSLQGSYIPISNVESKYNDLIDSLRNHYNSIEDEKHFLGVTIKTVSKNSTLLVLKVTSIILYGNFSNSYTTFGPDDWWKWWNGGTTTYGGYCAGPNNGQETWSDAAIQITNKVMIRKAVPSEEYYYGPPTLDVYLWPPDYPDPNHSGGYNYYSYYLLWEVSSEPNFHDCISPDEMNYYLTGAEHIVYTYDDDPNDPGARPEGMYFMSIFLQGNAIFGPPPNYVDTYFHDGWGYFGTLYQRSGGPNQF